VQLPAGELGAVKVTGPGDEYVHLEHRIQVDKVEGSMLGDGLAHNLCIGVECIAQRLDEERDIFLA
jgi:hypothetical protein